MRIQLCKETWNDCTWIKYEGIISFIAHDFSSFGMHSWIFIRTVLEAHWFDAFEIQGPTYWTFQNGTVDQQLLTEWELSRVKFCMWLQ